MAESGIRPDYALRVVYLIFQFNFSPRSFYVAKMLIAMKRIDCFEMLTPILSHRSHLYLTIIG